jgi:hypothetical protein
MNAIRPAISWIEVARQRLIVPRAVLWVIAAATLGVLCALSAMRINGSEVTADAAQNLQMGINLAHHGTISLDEGAPWHPTMYREPLPVAFNAAMVRLEDHFLGAAEATRYFTGARAAFIKYQNVLWAALLWSSVFAATRWLSGSLLLALIATLYAVRPFLGASSAEGVNDLYTELPGATLLTFGSLALAAATVCERRGLMIGAGLILGLATLTKAATLYVVAVLVLVLAATWAARASPPARRRRGSLLVWLIVSFLIVVAPWLTRNLADFGRVQISERGGLTLYTRALLDSMTPLEYRGSFYVWARPGWQRQLGSWLGFTPRDLEQGGRLQRLSQVPGSELERHDMAAEDAGRPQDAVTFYYQARAMRVRLEQRLERGGAPYPDVSADFRMQSMALAQIRRHPAHHFAVVVPLLWRGALIAFPALLAGLAYSLCTRRYRLACFLLPGLLTLCFYALLTHFEARPSLVVHGVEAAVLLLMLQALWRRALS